VCVGEGEEMKWNETKVRIGRMTGGPREGEGGE
jgi:hypothetical protein